MKFHSSFFSFFSSFFFQKLKLTYRNYSPSAVSNAFHFVKDKNIAIRKAAREYGIPEATLRHKLSGYVDPESVKSGTNFFINKF